MAEKERDQSPSATLTNDKAHMAHKEMQNGNGVDKAQVLEGQHEIDPVIEKRVTRKCDIHIIPWLFGIWYVS